MIIAVSGSVGTGKTTLSKQLAKKLGYRYIDVSDVIKKHKLNEGYDKAKKCWIVDARKLNKAIMDEVKGNAVIDSHMSHYLPKKYVDLVIITKCSLKTLANRLKKKKYSKSKIKANLEVEIFDVCLNEAKEAGHKVLVVDTTKGINIDKIAKKIKK
jgi:adenylate kinase